MYEERNKKKLVTRSEKDSGAVVVVQLAEWRLPTPEVCGSNLVIGKFYAEYLFSVN